MKRGLVSLVVLAIFGAGFAAGRYRAPAAIPESRPGRVVLYYVDPMHPRYTSHSPGTAPDCGMALVPVYEDESPAAEPAVRVSAGMQQAMGIRVAAVERAAGVDRLLVYGRVAADETRSYRIDAGITGYVRELSDVTTGSRVRKDQWLGTVSAPDLRSPFQGYLVALDLLARSKSAGDNEAQIAAAEATLDLSVDRLRTLGVSKAQLDEVALARRIPPAIRILAPSDGFVLARSVTAGQTVDRGRELYRVADLSRVWIMADVFGREAAVVAPGMEATVRVPGRGEIAGARVSSQVMPQFDSATQAVRVRIDADNPGYVLRPGMPVDVDLHVGGADALLVPADAVRDAGLEQLVFVEPVERSGVFHPRRVKTGWRGGGRIEILEGLSSGERIVVSGAFLLDSEARLPHAGDGMAKR